MSDQLRDKVLALMEQQQLPQSYYLLVALYLIPLAELISNFQANSQRSCMIAVNGAQGTGKSTLSEFLKLLLEDRHLLRCACLSIDDFYYTKDERMHLAEQVHPLLQTRGVPGTHDVNLGMAVCQQLMAAGPGSQTLVPRFNKAEDDRFDLEQWTVHKGEVDVLILEGWCVGARSQAAQSLNPAINDLEREQDADGTWRRYVNQCLQHDYDKWFAMIDKLVMLKAPSMDTVYNWRWQQEQQLIAKNNSNGSGLMNEVQVKHFISHYQRLTEYILEEMPQRADCVLELNRDHQVHRVLGPMSIPLKQAAAVS